ncbi:MAG TPA: energy-coupling factor ABC transporter permease [Anaerolineae bacterium]|jgi:cobalt/nickel transport system permease protein|nr:energy-coupling factor ABC transporter permease [Anaerolineae bacterium]
MSHIHLPDGVIPVFWWALGYIITAIILAVAFSRTKSIDVRRKVPLLGIISAIMLIGQSIPLGFIPFHLSLAVLAGIVLGPWLGFIAVFITNLFLALIGHGGITVVGLNTIVVGSEAILGYLLFNTFKRYMPSVAVAAIVSTVLALIVSISLMISVVAVSQVNPLAAVEGVREVGGVAGEPALGRVSIPRFIAIIAPFAIVGIIIESLAIGLIVRFVASIRPEIIGG